MITHEYAPGRLLDVHGDGDRGLVLLWHGTQPDVREVLAPLARQIAAEGVRVAVPDWSSKVEDRGRADLLTSVRFTRDSAQGWGLDPDRLTVAGWSLGGTAAVSLTVHAKRLGIALGSTVLLAPADGPDYVDPITGLPLPQTFAPREGRTTIRILHGAHDDVVTSASVIALDSRLRAAGWSTTLDELDADHGSIAQTRYDPPTDGYVQTDALAAVAVGRQVAATIAEAATSS